MQAPARSNGAKEMNAQGINYRRCIKREKLDQHWGVFRTENYTERNGFHAGLELRKIKGDGIEGSDGINMQGATYAEGKIQAPEKNGSGDSEEKSIKNGGGNSERGVLNRTKEWLKKGGKEGGVKVHEQQVGKQFYRSSKQSVGGWFSSSQLIGLKHSSKKSARKWGGSHRSEHRSQKLKKTEVQGKIRKNLNGRQWGNRSLINGEGSR